ncbi:prepilin-type N-terminal cleavage/methylation domain-containing protein [Candidatus Methylospira mobilis]|uniref:type IV pilus modification PilV family protein n=1 Tax=Candidatus Methylospira mobilis TaxID=1808979 RepID=UPI001D179046|nr:prepilin-type N-terminal cleavage/methylation domain-containing protein [Candidatus Methylospira mobilis]WNV03298.1 prepilin-type N-terminal cleavage/methylation domain-containing protein [Candidatus Methylospira mobilis]
MPVLKAGRQRGFSLLEVMVAFSIMAIAVSVLLRVFGSGLQLGSLSLDYARALQHAESLLAGVGVETPLQLGDSQGKFDERFHWQIHISPFQAEGAPIPQNLPLRALWVQVTVRWGAERPGQREREVALATLKLSAAPAN